MSDESKGLAGYSQGGDGTRRPGPRQVFEMMLRKAELRSLLQIEAAKIQEALPHLNAAETEQVQAMLASEVADADAETAALARQLDREAVLAASTKAMDVRLSREASRALQAEMMRRIERQGFCPRPGSTSRRSGQASFRGSAMMDGLR